MTLTMNKRMRFIGTLNNPGTHYPDFIVGDWLQGVHKQLDCVYTVGQLEKGDDGTPHVQFAIWLPKRLATRITALNKKVPHCHWEKVDQDNGVAAYCTKEDTRLEGPFTFGDPPVSMNTKGAQQKRAERNKVLLDKSIHDLADTGEISVLSVPALYKARQVVAQSRAIRDVEPLVGKLEDHNLWVHGSAGTGKTGYYLDYFSTRGGIYDKPKSKYWNCYDGQPAILIDDVEKRDADYMYGLLKQWCQHKPITTEDKFGLFAVIRPKHFVITSNYTPQEIWPDMDIGPLTRRFRMVHFTEIAPYRPVGHPDHTVIASSFVPGIPDPVPVVPEQVSDVSIGDIEDLIESIHFSDKASEKVSIHPSDLEDSASEEMITT